MSKSRIAFTKDIIEATASDLDIPVSKVEAFYKVMVNYFKDISMNTSVVALDFPFVGVVHAKKSSLTMNLKNIKEFKAKDTCTDKRKLRGLTDLERVLKKKIEVIDKHTLKMNKEGIKKASRHLQEKRENMHGYTNGLNFREIAQIQNEKNKQS